MYHITPSFNELYQSETKYTRHFLILFLWRKNVKCLKYGQMSLCEVEVYSSKNLFSKPLYCSVLRTIGYDLMRNMFCCIILLISFVLYRYMLCCNFYILLYWVTFYVLLLYDVPCCITYCLCCVIMSNCVLLCYILYVFFCIVLCRYALCCHVYEFCCNK